MESIKDTLAKHTIVVLNETLKHGFTQLPNYVLRDKKLSFGARLTFAILLSYAWQEDSCFPGQDRMSKDLGTSDRSVRTFLKELREKGYISWKQQGLNKPNIYYILDYQPLKLEADRNSTSSQERKRNAGLEWKQDSDYEYTEEEYSKKKKQNTKALKIS
jgi:hypothetical protein